MNNTVTFAKSYSPSDFDNLAQYILNNVTIESNGENFRICEIEFYYRNDDHKDEYVHKNIDQQKFEKFYFHKFSNGTFKAGTFKGIDIVLGNEENNTYFGILIRSLQNIETNEFTEGSCNCVNKLLKCFNVDNVKELFTTHYPNITSQISIFDPKLHLKITQLPHLEIYCGSRIGLSDKYPEFKNKMYRYATNIKYIKKQKKSFVKLANANTKSKSKIYVACGYDARELKIYDTEEELLIDHPNKTIEKLKNNVLFEHNDNFGFDELYGVIKLKEHCNKLYLLSEQWDSGMGGWDNTFYFFNKNDLLVHAKSSIESAVEITKRENEEYIDDMPDKDSEQKIKEYNKKNIDIEYIYKKLVKHNEIYFVDLVGSTYSFNIHIYEF